jgi:peptide chain release factor 3
VGYSAARWIRCEDKKKLEEFESKHLGNLAHDSEGHLAYLAPNAWRLDFVMEDWPAVTFKKTREHNL